MFIHGGDGTRLNDIWHGMRKRCRNPKDSSYRNYGGRGIEIFFTCFEDFRDWALNNGYRDDLTIDRIDYDGPYSRDNCRWATSKEQNQNKRTNVNITHPETGETLLSSEWSLRLCNNKSLVCKRIRMGWTPERAITTPARYNSGPRLTTEDVKQMRLAYRVGIFTQTELGRLFGVSQVQASNIVNNKCWVDV